MILDLKVKEEGSPILVFGNLINNKRYIAILESRGIRTIQNLDELVGGAIVVIRTHGIRREHERIIREKNRVLDLTCRNVKKVQLKIREHSESGFFALITGKKTHPEVEGLISYADEGEVIETEGDLLDFLARKTMPGRIFITSQTTGSRSVFEQTCAAVKARQPALVEIFDSICPVTELKEHEALRLQAEADVSFVIGDTLSSNAAKLYRILSGGEKQAWFIEDLEGLLKLNLPLERYKKALVVSSASTPYSIEEEIRRYLEKIPDA
jgi:4-hydroxy-3-methylbut-2-en-1-yl diphosphate reductase